MKYDRMFRKFVTTRMMMMERKKIAKEGNFLDEI